MRRAQRIHRHLAAIVAVAVLAACAPGADLEPRHDLDRAIEQYIEGDYPAAIAGLEAVTAASNDDAVRREAYTYLGRAHMALGHTDDAVTAFTLGARYGDRGVCVAYLETLKQYVGGSPQGLPIREVVTRSDLALAIVRLMDASADTPSSLGADAPLPIRRLEARGWMPALADGAEHADEPVTQAALYATVARMLAAENLSGRLREAMPRGYRRALADTAPVSGAEALAALERVRSIREHYGR